MAGPTLERQDPSRRFYIKTDWSKDGMGAVILQAYDLAETSNAEAQEEASESVDLNSTWKECAYGQFT